MAATKSNTPVHRSRKSARHNPRCPRRRDSCTSRRSRTLRRGGWRLFKLLRSKRKAHVAQLPSNPALNKHTLLDPPLLISSSAIMSNCFQSHDLAHTLHQTPAHSTHLFLHIPTTLSPPTQSSAFCTIPQLSPPCGISYASYTTPHNPASPLAITLLLLSLPLLHDPAHPCTTSRNHTPAHNPLQHTLTPPPYATNCTTGFSRVPVHLS